MKERQRRRRRYATGASIALLSWPASTNRASRPGHNPGGVFSVASEIVTGTGLWDSSIPGPMASPGGRPPRPRERTRGRACTFHGARGARKSARRPSGVTSAHGGRARFHRRPPTANGANRPPPSDPLTPLAGDARARLPGCLAGQVARGRLKVRAGGSRRGGQAGNRPHSWTGYLESSACGLSSLHRGWPAARQPSRSYDGTADRAVSDQPSESAGAGSGAAGRLRG
jgi:hypothetical protein